MTKLDIGGENFPQHKYPRAVKTILKEIQEVARHDDVRPGPCREGLLNHLIPAVNSDAYANKEQEEWIRDYFELWNIAILLEEFDSHPSASFSFIVVLNTFRG